MEAALPFNESLVVATEDEEGAEFEENERSFLSIFMTVVVILTAPLPLLIHDFSEFAGLQFWPAFWSVLPSVFVILITTSAYYRYGRQSHVYVVADHIETFTIQLSLGLLIGISSRPTNPYWFFYIVHVGHLSMHPSGRRVTSAIAMVTPIGVFFWHLATTGLSATTMTSLVVFSAALLFMVYTTGLQGRIARLRVERHSLNEQVLELQLEAERNRIARDLHDGLSADLTAIAWKAETLAHDRSDEELDAIARRARAAIDDTRSVVWALRGDPIPWDTLLTGVRSRCMELCSERAELVLDLQVARKGRVPGDLALDLLRMAQEAVRNALRHGDPSKVCVTLLVDREIVLRVEDDGRGLGEPTDKSANGSGLRNLHHRVNANNGTLELAALDPGTRVEVFLPLPSVEGTPKSIRKSLHV